MPVDRTQLTTERIDALLRLISENGTTPAGETPADHAAALRDVEQLGSADEIADAHQNGLPQGGLTDGTH